MIQFYLKEMITGIMRKYEFLFKDLNINVGTIERFIGYEVGKSPEPVRIIIEELIMKAPEMCNIRGGYVIIDRVDVDRKSGIIIINETELNVRKIISNQMKNSDKVALFLCTAGSGIGDYSKTMMAQGDLLEGYIADAIGSETVEAAIDRIQDILEKEMSVEGLNITDRYSPGYCGWSVSDQKKIFPFFPDAFCGIKLNDSSLMDPIKSVSGIIGIGKNIIRKGYACNYCKITNCITRKEEYHGR